MDVGPDGKSLRVGYSIDYAVAIPEKLLFGNVIMSRSLEKLESEGITAILNLIKYSDGAGGPRFTDRLRVLHCPVEDLPLTGIHWVHSPAAFVDEELSRGGRVYVHCSQGISRAATFTLFYLMTRKSMSLRDAFQYLRSARPVICPSIGFIKGLANLEAELQGTSTLSPEDYSIMCCQELFPNLSVEECAGYFEECRETVHRDSATLRFIIEKAGTENIDPVGYYYIDKLIEKYPGQMKQRKGCSLHHPFD
jgi:hypothetical protein